MPTLNSRLRALERAQETKATSGGGAGSDPTTARLLREMAGMRLRRLGPVAAHVIREDCEDDVTFAAIDRTRLEAAGRPDEADRRYPRPRSTGELMCKEAGRQYTTADLLADLQEIRRQYLENRGKGRPRLQAALDNAVARLRRSGINIERTVLTD